MNPFCPDYLKKLVPLSKVVAAAIIDVREDIGRSQQVFFHWAARGLKKLQSETLKSGKRRVIIKVNPNTRTGTLPPDFDYELFVGYINSRHEKVPITLNGNITNQQSITDIPCEDICPKCSQDKTICNDLVVTESEEIMVIGDTTAVKTTIKKLYPNGDYFLEISMPYWDIQNGVVAYAPIKEFIAHIDLKECGCIDPTEKNIETIKDCCYDAYCSHYAPCCECDHSGTGYNIFEETGLIQFDHSFKAKHFYMEYIGFIPKLNGQYAVPEVAFETLVEWTKAMSVDGKSNVSNTDKQYRWSRFTVARRSMYKVMARLSIDVIVRAFLRTPTFDWISPAWNNFCPLPESDTVAISNDNICEAAATACSSSSSSPKLTPFQIAVKVPQGTVEGLPIPGLTTYQSDVLKGALNLEYIIVNRATEVRKSFDFAFDTDAGQIDRAPNIWFPDDTLIINFNKMV